MSANITFENGSYTVQFGFDRALVNSLKNTIPYQGRRWNQENKCWLVDPRYKNHLQILFPDCLIADPAANSSTLPQETSIDLLYVGQVKERGDGTVSAYGYVGNDWKVVFPETVLREWFEGTEDHPKLDTSTLYGVLGVLKDATGDEIKTGYRRMAKQWHPDVCREVDANKNFLKVREAYDILSNPDKKIRYDVGLSFTDRKKKKPAQDLNLYKPPLRCGRLHVSGKAVLGKLIIEKIYAWDDILDTEGNTLVSSWVMGDKTPTISWF